MKIYFTSLLLISLLTLNCSDRNVTGPVTVDDSKLSSQIIGKWSGNTYKIAFYPDHTFSDTFFTTLDSTQILRQKYSRHGEFEIQNGVLYLKTAHWTFFDSTFIERGISIIPNETEINISGNTLYQKVVDVFENVEGNGYQIWGKWKNIKWTYNFSGPPENITYEGREEYYYNFYKDSAKVTFGWRYIDGGPWSDVQFRSDFNYTFPFLDIIGQAMYHMRVEFKYGKMFWYHNYPGFVIYREG